MMSIGCLLDLFSVRPQAASIVLFEPMSAGEALLFGVKGSMLELAVLYLILRPWTFTTRTRYRALLALILLLPYTGLLLLFGPGGEWSQWAHVAWLMAIVLTLAMGTIKPIEVAGDSTIVISSVYEPKRLL
jgi:hypothetical protein